MFSGRLLWRAVAKEGTLGNGVHVQGASFPPSRHVHFCPVASRATRLPSKKVEVAQSGRDEMISHL